MGAGTVGRLANRGTAVLCAAVMGLLCLVLIRGQEVHAGAWTQRESEGSVYLQAIATRADHGFDGTSSLFASQRYDKLNGQLFLEYGASDWLTLLFAPELLAIDIGAPTDASYSGFGYTDFGGRLRLGEGTDWVFSLQVLGRAPGAKPDAGPAAIGYLEGEADLRLLGGLSFLLWGLPAFLDVEVAQRLRFGAPPDEWRFDATLGVRVAPQWMLLLQSFNVVSEGAGTWPFIQSYEYYKVQAGAMLDLTPQMSVSLSLVSTYFARNALQENGVVLGVLYRY
ncbi:MAG: hypothetical protein B7Z15_15450 [Rhizobiales bacterium 32-66-8]|nr:MAG: hypothetical protein B7Z15_15450 [Rhizobiales bacterium 32-66-8]